MAFRLALDLRLRALAALLLAVIALHAVPPSAIPLARTSGAAFSASTLDVAVVDRRLAVTQPEAEQRPPSLPPPFAPVSVPLAQAAPLHPAPGADLRTTPTLLAALLRPATPARAPPFS